MATNFECESRFMVNVLEHYNTLRGKHKNAETFVFWDAVVLSASDIGQQLSYQLQLAEKQNRLELPRGIPFHIFCDPPNTKIGCGGSALLSLEKLLSMYGRSLLKMRILFIPAGGYGQRLPSHSVLGKLFCPVPYNSPMYQMFDLILAMYLPFLNNMSPGVFLASSDAIFSYCLEDTAKWSFRKGGFTALAHPSPMSVGEQHGVYVLGMENALAKSYMTDCLKVLQKPSQALMIEEGAVVKDFVRGDGKRGDIVFSDSAFFFDMDVALRLVRFYKKIKPLHFELNSFSDFLQPLGLAPQPCYIQDDDQEAFSIRMKLYELLQGTPLHILVMKQSTFYHLGTMPEYIENYCGKNTFLNNFTCERFVCSSVIAKKHSLSHIEGTVMCSSLHADSKVPKTSVVEFCDFSVPVVVGENCIISNCKLSESVKLKLPVEIPDELLFHTVSVHNGYVTICFSVTENLKASCELENMKNLSFLNIDLGFLVDKFISHPLFDRKKGKVSLWHAKLFPVCSSMEESFKNTIELVHSILRFPERTKFLNIVEQSNFMSMEDILRFKNFEQNLTFQRLLYEDIISRTD